MVADFLIRPYALSDRDELRKMCCDTANRGNLVESFFHDREVFADFLTRYYTDFEPEALWVAEAGDVIIGYLMGCLDSRRYINTLLWRITPKALIRAIGRGIFFRREIWRLLGAALKSYQIGGFRRYICRETYPGHLHIAVKEKLRGQGVGRRLIERFFTQAKTKGLKGIYVTVRGDNAGACKFFEHMGFIVLSRHPMFMPYDNTFKIGYTVIYGRIL